MAETAFLEQSALWYDSDEGFKRDWGSFHKRLMAYRFARVDSWMRGDNCLELGTADGESTQYLFPRFARVVAVDGAEHFVEFVKKRFREQVDAGAFEVHLSLFETFETEERFDVVLATHILEHLEDPVGFLRRAKRFLKPDGVLIAMVPNAGSLHRQVAVKMGLLETPQSFNPQDIQLGHLRIYYPEELRADIEAAGLEVVEQGGIFLKPLTNKQIQETWTQEMMDGFYELGKEYPEIAAETYAVCRLPR